MKIINQINDSKLKNMSKKNKVIHKNNIIQAYAVVMNASSFVRQNLLIQI